MKNSAFLKNMEKIWRDIGNYMVQLIRADFERGKFQNDLSGLRYKSKQYVKYKSTGMKRQTKEFKSGKGKAFTKYGKSTGKRLSAFAGQAIESTTTTFVDMTLTGQTKKGLHVDKAEADGVWLAYRPADTQKILAGAKVGRQVYGLSSENKELVEKLLIDRINKQITENQVKTINITWRF